MCELFDEVPRSIALIGHVRRLACGLMCTETKWCIQLHFQGALSSFFHKHAPLLALSMSASCCVCAANSSSLGSNTRSLGRDASVLNTAGLRVVGASFPSRLSWPRVIAKYTCLLYTSPSPRD